MQFDLAHPFGHWLAGFVDGEGSFMLNRRRGHLCPRFQVAVRVDDAAILHEACGAVGVGHVSTQETSQGRPAAVWLVDKLTDCRRIVELFRAYPLRAKKARDFEIWAEAVEHLAERPYGRGFKRSTESDRAMALFAERLREARAYTIPNQEFVKSEL